MTGGPGNSEISRCAKRCDRMVSSASKCPGDCSMTNETSRNGRTRSRVRGVAFIMASTAGASGQILNPLGFSVATPRPISPAEGTTTPSAEATQRQNPYLGSVPSKNTGTRIELSLRAAIQLGLRYNLGLVEANLDRA